MDPVTIHPTNFKTQRTKFGLEARMGGVSKTTPGPGEYNDKDTYSSEKPTPPTWNCQSRDAWDINYTKMGPGPGTYDYDKALKSGQITSEEWVMAEKLEGPDPPRGSSRYINPGPPAYKTLGAGAKNNDVIKHHAPIWGFGTAQRF